MRSPRARTVARRSLAVAGASAFSALGLLALGGVASADTTPASTTPATTTLPNEVVPGLSTMSDGGAVAGTTPMTVGVGMDTASASKTAAYEGLFTPGSPTFHQWYTPASYEAAFGVSQAAATYVRDWSTRSGLKVTYANPDGSYLELSGTAAEVDSTFDVTETTFTNGSSSADQGAIAPGRTFVANDVAPTVPATVSGVSGLNTLMTYSATPSAASAAAGPEDCDTVPGKCIGALTPSDIRSVYGVPSTDLGQGQKVAIFGEGELTTVVHELRGFESTYNQPQVPVKEVLVGDDLSDSSGDVEWELDSQASTGMAPDLSELDFYFGSSLDDPSITATYNAWAFDPSGPLTGNSSFGGAEPLEEADGFLEDQPLQMADMEGRTMFASAGDVGGSCLPGANGVVGTGVPCVEYPASSPYVAAVGGTILYTDADATGNEAMPVTRNDEYSWEYSGGGTSDFEKAPSWQPAAFPANGATEPPGVDSSTCTTTGTCMRAVPDISSLSGDVVSNGYAFYTGGAVSEEGGTSLSSPLWAGMWANVQADYTPSTTCANSADVSAEGAKATSAGFAPPDLYAIAATANVSTLGTVNASQDTASFFDVGGATDSMQSTNQQQFTLPRSGTDPTGYDFVSGLGSPMLGGIIANVDCGAMTAVNPGLPTNPDTVSVYSYGTTPPYNTPATTGCTTNGTAMAGPTLPATAVGDLQLVSATLTSDAASTTFATKVASLATAAAVDDDYAFEFTFGANTYAVTIDTGATPSAELYELVVTSTPAGLGVQGVPTDLGALPAPTINTATDTLSVQVPFTTITSEAGPSAMATYGPGTQLTQLVVFSNVGPATTALANDFNVDPLYQIDFFQCPYTVPGTATSPSSALPESPVEVLLPLGALVAGGWVLRRRHLRKAA